MVATVSHETNEHDRGRVFLVFAVLVFLCLMGIFVRVQTAKPKTSETTRAKIEQNSTDIVSLQEQISQVIESQQVLLTTMNAAIKNGSAQRETILENVQEIDAEIEELKP